MCPLVVLLAAASCRDDDQSQPPACNNGSEQCDIQHAITLATGDPLPVWPTTDTNRPVLLYVDRSQSMRGFLDRNYRTHIRTEYRSVLDGFRARLQPAQVFGFGNEVRAESGGLEVLGSSGFYSDGNTEMEKVLHRVELDSALNSTHVIIGDGRRTHPDVANGQFEQIRMVAERWTASGGTFIVAASHAPFEPVEDDTSGCRPTEAAAGSTRMTCPLYAFAFVARGDQGRVATVLAATFENLFVTPLPALPEAGVMLAAQSTPIITMKSNWATATNGARIARVGGRNHSPQPLHARIAVADTTSSRGRSAWAALRGQQLVPKLRVRRLADSAAAAPWQAPAGNGGLLRLTEDPLALDFFTHGDTVRSLYCLELHPAGEPAWLDAYDAEKAGETRRTYGLGRLFESFRAVDPLVTPPVLRIYVVAN